MASRISLPLLGCVLVASCGKEPAPPHIKSGEQLYNYYCADCHQGAGDGKPLKGVPPVRHTQLTCRELVSQILGQNKIEGSRMPVLEISKQQAEAIAIHVRRNLNAG